MTVVHFVVYLLLSTKYTKYILHVQMSLCLEWENNMFQTQRNLTHRISITQTGNLQIL